MSKKLILFLMVLLFGSTSFLRADELTVCDGTETNAYVPVYGFYGDAYLKCHYVMPADQLTAMNGGVINSMTFEMASPAEEPWTGTFQVFMTEVDYTEISAFVDETSAVTVYTGTLDATGATMTVTFDTPYSYEGGNLLIGFNLIQTGNYKSASFNGVTATGASVQGYSYSALSAITPTQRNFLPKTTFVFESGTVPPVPTGELTITPNDFTLGERPANGWMEPLSVRINNGAEPVTVTATLSNTSGVGAITMEPALIQDLTLETGDEVALTISTATGVTAGEYTEEFTMFTVNAKNIATIPVTATLYTAGEADIVETAKTIALSYTSGVANFSETPANLHANYFGYNQNTALDAVYEFSLVKDAKISVEGGVFIGIYNKVLDFHPTAAIMPVAMTYDGTLTDEILLAGDYYMIVAGHSISTIEGTVEQLPAPTAITNIAPANFATGIEGDSVELTWEGGENAAEYQVLFGTSPTNTPVALDWTVVDENYRSFEATGLVANTQYFWQIKVRNSNGSVTGPRWGFTTALTAPKNVTASAEEIFTDESTLIKWKHSSGTGGFTGEITVADGTETSSYVPVYGLWMDDYTRSEMIYPASMLEEMEGGEITSIKYYISTASSGSWAPATFNVYMMEVDATTLSTYYGSTNATVVYSGALDGTGTEMTITLDTPYEYEGGNLLVGIEQPVVGTYHSCYFYGVTSNGSSASGYSGTSLPAVTFNQRDFLPKATFTCGGKGNDNRTFQSFNLYVDGVMVNEDPIYEKQYLLEDLEYAMPEGHAVTVTAVYDEGESLPSTPVTVYVSGYGAISGQVTSLATTQAASAPVAGATVTFTGKDEFNNNVEFTGTTDDNGAYIINGVKVGTYTGVATLEGNEPAYTEANPVAVVYDTTTEEIDFIMHEEYKPVTSVLAEEVDPTMSRVKWSLNYAINGGGAPVVSDGDEFFEDFENGAMPAGWTTIDADGDSFNWEMASTVMSTGYGHNASTDCILSQSYDNNYGVLYPDNYLVTPQVLIGGSSVFSFYACAQDSGYPAEHFGVAVSTTTATAAAFEMVEEWTMTAKGTGVMAPGRDGQTRAQGAWYEKTVDLSAYAGQQVYIAIRHFNCSDMFYLDVDDIALANAGKNRIVQEYALYKKAILKETPITPEDSIYIKSQTDTLYADFNWVNDEPGLYQYGVSAHYPTPLDRGNRDEIVIGDGTSTTYVTPYNSLWGYSFVEQIYTAEEIGTAGTINSIAFNMQSTDSQTNDIEIFMVNTATETFTATTDYVAVTAADKVFDGSVTFNEGWTTITLDTPFQYDGTSNLMIGMHEYTSGYSTKYFYYTSTTGSVVTFHSDSANPDPYNLGSYSGNSYVSPNRANITIDITPGGGAGGNDNPVTPITWSNILPKDMQTVLTVNVTSPADIMDGAIVELVNQFEIGTDFAAVVDSLGTPIVFDDFRKGEYVLFCEMPGFVTGYEEGIPVSIWGEETITINCQEIFSPVDGVSVAVTGFASWTDMIGGDRYPERYMLKLNGVYYTETDNNYIQIDDDLLTIGETYTFEVAVVYSMGLSSYVGTSFVYGGCEGVETQVDTLYVDEEASTGMNVALVWNEGVAPGPTPPTPPTPGAGSWTEGFESGLPTGWQIIDANNDGWTWCLTSNIPTTWTYYASLSLDWYRTGTNAICSGSFINGVGALTPDEYLITPLQTITAGTTFSFYAAATDASYPADHFGVFVSDNAQSWTSVQEWTLTAKKGASNGGRASRDGEGAKLGTWHQYTVDLSNYAGNKYIAIRHFNCNDQYIMCVDDIEFSTPDKVTYASAESCGTAIPTAPVRAMWDLVYSFSGTSAGQQAVATDGEYIYTASWQSTPTGGYTFYKYDLQGNFVEGFNIAGATAIRDITYDGQYFYGTSGASQIFCMDFTNKTLVSTINCSGLTSRHISYDPVRDGFWSGNWETLALYSRTGALVQSGPVPTSAYGSAYYKDSDNVEHLYLFCQPNSDAKVYDYDIANNTISSSPVFDFASTPGYNAGISGGCFIGNYEGKACFFGNIQQDPNLIGIYELGAAQGGGGGGGGTVEGLTPNKFNIAVDDLDNVVAATSDMSYMLEAADYEMHTYYVFYVDAQYGISCPEAIEYQCEPEAIEENAIVNAIYPNPTSGDLHINAEAMTHITIVNAMGQVVYTMDVNADETVIDMAKFEAGVYMVSVITENGTTVKRVTVVK